MNDTFITGFRYATPYINAHRNQRFVFALNGSTLAHPNFNNIVHDIAVLHSLGIHIVLVHGFRHQLESTLQENGIESQYHCDLRITNTSNLSLIEQIAGQLRIKIEAAFSNRIGDTPLNGAQFKLCSGNLVTAKPMGIIDGIDMQHTGQVRHIDVDTLEENIQKNNISLLSTLAYSTTGEVFNLSLIDLASTTATHINADKLIIFQADQGLLDEQYFLIRQINSRCEHSQIQKNQLNLYKKLIDASKKGIHRIHVLSHEENGALLTELFTHIGAGTLISQEEYEKIREAQPLDVNSIIELIRPLEEKGILVPRSKEQIEIEINHFFVVECDQRIIGCAALYPHDTSAEIACIVTHPNYQKKGLAAHLLTILEGKARELHCEFVFVLTTQTAHWFLEKGFKTADVSALPAKKQTLYNGARNSKILIKII